MSRRPDLPTLVLGVALATAVLRGLAFAGTELYADEAYYWLWSTRPASGYFDHPPMVAWLGAAARVLLRSDAHLREAGLPPAAIPDAELWVRLPFLLIGALTVGATALLARELARGAPGAPDLGRVTLGGALLGASAPLLQLTGAMALPDEPVVLFTTAALALLARARGRRWLLAGVAVGLALLSKYTAALLAPALLLALPLDADLRRQLRSGWPWLGAAAAVAVFLPCLLWNARHGWISIAFQLRHGFGGEASLSSFVEYLGGQLAGAGPVALLAGGAALARGAWRGDPGWRRVALAALVPLGVTTWSAARGHVEANWPALAYPALAAGAAVWLARGGARRFRAGLACAVGPTVALLGAFAYVQHHPALLAGTAVVERFHGWRQAAAAVRRATAAGCFELRCDPAQPLVLPQSYQTAAELAFYGGYERLAPAVERPSQLDVWADGPGGGAPRRIGPLFHVGTEPPSPEERDALGLAGERPPTRIRVVLPGMRQPLRELVVTPFSTAHGTPRSR